MAIRRKRRAITGCLERFETFRPLRVMHVVLSLDVGGMERIVLALLKEGRRLGQQVSVLCIESPGALARDVFGIGVHISCLGKGPGLRVGAITPAAEIIARVRPDVVHTHQIGALAYAAPAARWHGVPVLVHTEHGKHYGAHARAHLLGRFGGVVASRFFCVSQDIADQVVGERIAPRHKVCVVPNGIEIAQFGLAIDRTAIKQTLNIPAAAPVVGTVGRLSPVKRQDVLIKAFKRLKNRHQDAHLLLVGDGPSKSELRSLAAELSLQDCVHFAGYQACPERFLKVMTVFALTSESEGMPLSVLEAWAARVPVVASRVGGLQELIQEGRTGYLFPPGDDQSLADILDGALGPSECIEGVRSLARHKVESCYTIQQTAQKYHCAYMWELARRGIMTKGREHTSKELVY